MMPSAKLICTLLLLLGSFSAFVQDAFAGRYYNSTQGRFISRDPIRSDPLRPLAGDGYRDGMSLYRAYYVPNGLDPYGLAEILRKQIKDGDALCGTVVIDVSPAPDNAATRRLGIVGNNAISFQWLPAPDSETQCGSCCEGGTIGWIQMLSKGEGGAGPFDNPRRPTLWGHPDATHQPVNGSWYGGWGNPEGGTNPSRPGDAAAPFDPANPYPQGSIYDAPGGAEQFTTQVICTDSGKVLFSYKWSSDARGGINAGPGGEHNPSGNIGPEMGDYYNETYPGLQYGPR